MIKKVKEYVIKDNLLRRHLSTEQKYILIATLSEVYEAPEPKRDYSGKFTADATLAHTEQDAKLASGSEEDVLTKTAKDTGGILLSPNLDTGSLGMNRELGYNVKTDSDISRFTQDTAKEFLDKYGFQIGLILIAGGITTLVLIS